MLMLFQMPLERQSSKIKFVLKVNKLFIFIHIKISLCFAPNHLIENFIVTFFNFILFFFYLQKTDLGGNNTSSDVIQNVLLRLAEEDIYW